MRADRQKIELLTQGGADYDTITGAKVRYFQRQDEYVKFSKAMNLPEQWERVTVNGKNALGSKLPQKAASINKITAESVAKSAESGIIRSGAISGALNPYSKEAERHAEQYYEAVRHMTTDTKKISQFTGINQDKIDKIKNHIFVQEHDLLEGHKRFDPSYDMAQSWQRLINGKYEEKDIVLLKHEYAELRYMEKGLSQSEAHIKASKRYNYAQYCD